MFYKSYLLHFCINSYFSKTRMLIPPPPPVQVKFIHDQTSANPKYKGFYHGVREIINTQGEESLPVLDQPTVTLLSCPIQTFLPNKNRCRWASQVYFDP